MARLYPGATLDEANEQCIRALEENGFRLLERSVNHTLFCSRDRPQTTGAAVRLMTGDDETDFRRLHDAPDMYWDAERILRCASDWRVYLLGQGTRAGGVLLCGLGDWPEIFGVEFENDVFCQEGCRALMIACLNDLHAAGYTHLSYFEEEEQALPILTALGFERVGG